MRLPRRVPWASLSELDQVCSWIYTDETDADAKLKAIHRLSAWRAITPLPHALEATLSLLSSIILDEQYAAQSHRPQDTTDKSSKNISALNVRQSYASAIVRLVNGFVDPLQLGAYARSIASIAAQIGLPLWLVDLRHAATHEDLPSLELLRTGARESLTWLLHNYFLPTLSVSSAEQTAPIARLSPLPPLLKSYKSLMKTISRDASLKSQYKDELTRTIREIERWIGEAKVAASTLLFNGWGTSDPGEREENERWALERLCESLTAKGGLVPASSRKRLDSNLKSPPILPPAVRAVWSPLLSTLKTSHPSLPAILVSIIVDRLINDPASQNEGASSKDVSYELCLAAWAAWCIGEWETVSDDEMEEDMVPLRRKDVIMGLLSALAIRDEGGALKKGANTLLKLLTAEAEDRQLDDISTSLLVATRLPATENEPLGDDQLQTMEERLNVLVSSTISTSASEDPPARASADSCAAVGIPAQQTIEMPRGWARIPTDAWRPCPVGVFRC